MITAIFDFSNMLHRSMFQISNYGAKGYTFNKQFELDQLMRKLVIDTAFTIRQLNVTRVIFALDSRSWRKNIEIEENEGYKSNRIKAKHLNWENIYSLVDEFCDIMESHQFIISKIDTAEADDLMALWRDKLLFKNNEHVIFVTGDEDIRQLVAFYPYDLNAMAFATVFNPFTQGKNAKKKLYVSNHFKEWLEKKEEYDIFNRGINSDQDAFQKLLKYDKVSMIQTDGENIVLRKIFCGDDGDNIPAIYSWIGKTKAGNSKNYRITPSKYEKIKEKFKLTDYHDCTDKLDEIYKEISLIANHNPSFKMIDRFKRQIDLVVLDSNVMPSKISDEFNKTFNEKLKISQPKVIGATMNSLLEGTKYIDENRKSQQSESSIFKDIDNISQKLF